MITVIQVVNCEVSYLICISVINMLFESVSIVLINVNIELY